MITPFSVFTEYALCRTNMGNELEQKYYISFGIERERESVWNNYIGEVMVWEFLAFFFKFPLALLFGLFSVNRLSQTSGGGEIWAFCIGLFNGITCKWSLKWFLTTDLNNTNSALISILRISIGGARHSGELCSKNLVCVMGVNFVTASCDWHKKRRNSMFGSGLYWMRVYLVSYFFNQILNCASEIS